MDFDEVKKEHILLAIKDFEQKGYPNGLSYSKYYDVEIEGQLYPPKPIMAYANMHASGKEPGNYFSGGKDTACWQAFERIGVTIVKKTNSITDQSINDLIDNYKKLIRSNGLENEKYKWELIRDSKGQPSLEKNLEQELSKIKFNNILYQLAVPCIKGIAREFEKELKVEFQTLFDNSIDLNTRVAQFNKNTLKLYRKAKGENSHHQDERSIAAYLTLQNPAEYTFYKSTYYTEYCKLINEKSAKAKEKYSHYLELIKDLAENYISKDDELIDIVHKELNELVVADPNYLLVAQDMLYQLLDAQRGKNYWIFQGNPKVFDFETALRDKILTDWTVSAHKDKIKTGDRVILWITGDKSGCYALAEITSNPQKKTNVSDDHLWKEEDTSELKAGIKITHNLVDSPILKLHIQSEKKLEGLNVGHRGTNFNATKSQYDAILDMIKTNNSLPNEHQLLIDRIQLLGFEETNEFYNQLDKIKLDLSLKSNDDRLCFSLDKDSNIALTVLDRYSIGAEVRKRSVNYMYMDYSNGRDHWLKYPSSFSEVDFAYRFMIEAISSDLEEGGASRFIEHNSEAFEKSLHDLNYRNQIFNLAFNEEFKTRKKRRFWLYAPGKEAYKWEEFYEKGCMGLNYDELGDLNQYDSQAKIEKKLGKENSSDSAPINHSKANYQFCNELSIGDFVIVKKGREEYLGYGLVESDYFFDDTLDSFKSQRKVKWIKKGSWKSEHTTALKTLTDITDVNYKPNPKLKAYEGIYKLINSEHMVEKTYHHPINTIFYGPPGTGKTYNTVLRAAEIIKNRKIDSYDEALEIFNANLHDQIEFITFHQNYSYEDFIQGLRPETDNKSSLVFDKKDGVFKKIADKALENLKIIQKAPDDLTNESRFDKALELFSDKVLESEENFKINDNVYLFEVDEESFRYTGEKWINHTGNRMKFSDLKEFYRNNVKSRKDVNKLTSVTGLAKQHATYYFLVYSEILKLLPKKAEVPQKVTQKNYVIIIDEINRANISRVFGELITLIEPDKRSHGRIPLEAKLPSGDPFIVPSNLFIIGTMNTADKSIALLDIALRRRFEFESMYPKYEIKNQVIYDVDILKSINEQIINSKGHDFQIGHSYFMGENKDLVQRINRKVIPLLLEYYMNDEKEVKSILNSAGLKIEENSWPLKISGKND